MRQFNAAIICGPASARTEEPVALEKHMAYFADKYAQLNRASMQEKLMKMGLGQDFAYAIADMVSYVGGILVKGCPYAEFTGKEAVGKLNHARDTGIFNLDGSINEERWQKLRTYAEMDGGQEIMTEKRFYEYLQWSRDIDARPDETGDAKKSSDDEWGLFFMLVTDHWKKSENDYERSVKLATLRKFYDDTPAVFDEVINRRLPVPKPLI